MRVLDVIKVKDSDDKQQCVVTHIKDNEIRYIAVSKYNYMVFNGYKDRCEVIKEKINLNKFNDNIKNMFLVTFVDIVMEEENMDNVYRSARIEGNIMTVLLNNKNYKVENCINRIKDRVDIDIEIEFEYIMN